MPVLLQTLQIDEKRETSHATPEAKEAWGSYYLSTNTQIDRLTIMHALFVNFALAISSGVTLGSNLPGLTAIPFHREIPAHALKTNLERQRERSAFRSAAATNSVPSRASIEETQSPKARRQASLARCYSPQAWKSRAAAEKTATTTESGAWSLRGTSAAKLSPNFNSTFEPARALDSVNTPFVSCWDIIYYGEIQLGSDLQPLQVRILRS